MDVGHNKRSRSSNFTAYKKSVLADLCSKYKDVIDCKRTDALNNQAKQTTWLQIEQEFNAVCENVKTVSQLKHVRISDNLTP